MTFGIFNLERSRLLHWRGQSLYTGETAAVQSGRGRLPSEDGDATAHRVTVIRLCKIVSLGGTCKGTALFFARFATGQSSLWCYKSRRTFHQLHAILFVPVELEAGWTGTFIAAQRVYAAIFTTSFIYTALVNISAVCQAIKHITFVTKALETSCRVDTEVVTCSVKRALVDVLTGPLIGQQFVAFFAAALKAAHCVSAYMVTTAVVKATLVNIFASLSVRL